MIDTRELFGDLRGYYNHGMDIRHSNVPLYHVKNSKIPFPIFMYLNHNAKEGDVEYYQMLNLSTSSSIAKTYNDIYNSFYSDRMRYIRVTRNAWADPKLYYVGQLCILECDQQLNTIKLLLCIIDKTGLYDRAAFIERMLETHVGTSEVCIDNSFVNHDNVFMARLCKHFEKNKLPAYKQYCDVSYRSNLNKYLFPYGSAKKFTSVKEKLQYDKELYKYLDLNSVIHGNKKSQCWGRLGTTVEKDINELHTEMEQYLNIETGEQENGCIRSGLSEHREFSVPV